MEGLKESVEGIIDDCMIYGTHGWPPLTGGADERYGGKKLTHQMMIHHLNFNLPIDLLHGPIGVIIYGVPNYRKLYAQAEVMQGGVLAGQSAEVDVFNHFLADPKRPLTQEQAPPNTSKPPATQRTCRSCSAQHSCPTGRDYQCVAAVMEFANTRLMEGCCRLNSYWIPQGRRLLSNSSLPEGVNASAAGAPIPAPSPMYESGCPCNCTCVSRACCDTKDKVVHEPASLRRGFWSLRTRHHVVILGQVSSSRGWRLRTARNAECRSNPSYVRYNVARSRNNAFDE